MTDILLAHRPTEIQAYIKADQRKEIHTAMKTDKTNRQIDRQIYKQSYRHDTLTDRERTKTKNINIYKT